MRGTIFEILIALGYVAVLYAGIPLGLLFLVWGLSLSRSAKRTLAASGGVAAPAEPVMDGEEPQNDAEAAQGMYLIGGFLIVVSGGLNLWHYYG